jgi:SIR2-like domain
MKLVIFCGAGFSAYAGLPLMSNFSDRLRASEVLGDRQSDFDAIQLECDSMGAFIGGSARNVEQLASFLGILELTRPSFEFKACKAYRRPKLARELVMEGMRSLVCQPVAHSRFVGRIRTLFDLRSQAEITFVTTNYDLLIEFAALHLSHNCTPSDPVWNAASRNVSGPQQLYSPWNASAVRLFKLHGSVNWFVDSKEEFHAVSGADTTTEKWDMNLCLPAGVAADPVMVPPSVLKPDLKKNLVEEWVGASDAIANADAIWFIGYSFPETDSYMRYFLASALCKNVKLTQLAVIDPNFRTSSIARNLFKSPSLREAFVSFPVYWEEILFEQLLQRKPIQESVTPGVLGRIENEGRWRRAMTMSPDLPDPNKAQQSSAASMMLGLI